MKKINLTQKIDTILNTVGVKNESVLKMHPSLEKEHQPFELYEKKMENALSQIQLPEYVIQEAYKYYLSNGELDDICSLELNSIVCVGPVHSGKTLYLVSRYIIAMMIAASYPAINKLIVFTNHIALIHEFKKCIMDKSIMEGTLYDRYMKADVLFIDDLFATGLDTDYALNILYSIIDYRHFNRRITLVTTNLTEDDFLKLSNGERFYRRLTEHAEILTFKSK